MGRSGQAAAASAARGDGGDRRRDADHYVTGTTWEKVRSLNLPGFETNRQLESNSSEVGVLQLQGLAKREESS